MGCWKLISLSACPPLAVREAASQGVSIPSSSTACLPGRLLGRGKDDKAEHCSFPFPTARILSPQQAIWKALTNFTFHLWSESAPDKNQPGEQQTNQKMPFQSSPNVIFLDISPCKAFTIWLSWFTLSIFSQERVSIFQPVLAWTVDGALTCCNCQLLTFFLLFVFMGYVNQQP